MKWYRVRVQVSARGVAIYLYIKAYNTCSAANLLSNILPENTILLDIAYVADITKE